WPSFYPTSGRGASTDDGSAVGVGWTPTTSSHSPHVSLDVTEIRPPFKSLPRPPAEMKDGKHVLTLSDDFKTPDTPAPHWQVVESKGNAYLLNLLMVKGGLIGGDKFNKTITLPSYIPDIAKVQIWCAWAEVLLGESSFETPIK